MKDDIKENKAPVELRAFQIEDIIREKGTLYSLRDIILMQEAMGDDIIYRYNKLEDKYDDLINRYTKLEDKYDVIIDLIIRINKSKDQP